MARKKKSSTDLDLLNGEIGGVDSTFSSEFRADDYSNVDDTPKFSDAADKFEFLLKFDEPFREYTKVDYKGETKNVIPIGKMPKSGKYILSTKKGETIITSIENIKLI